MAHGNSEVGGDLNLSNITSNVSHDSLEDKSERELLAIIQELDIYIRSLTKKIKNLLSLQLNNHNQDKQELAELLAAALLYKEKLHKQLYKVQSGENSSPKSMLLWQAETTKSKEAADKSTTSLTSTCGSFFRALFR